MQFCATSFVVHLTDQAVICRPVQCTSWPERVWLSNPMRTSLNRGPPRFNSSAALCPRLNSQSESVTMRTGFVVLQNPSLVGRRCCAAASTEDRPRGSAALPGSQEFSKAFEPSTRPINRSKGPSWRAARRAWNTFGSARGGQARPTRFMRTPQFSGHTPVAYVFVQRGHHRRGRSERRRAREKCRRGLCLCGERHVLDTPANHYGERWRGRRFVWVVGCAQRQ